MRTPKIYFLDTGLAACLQGWRTRIQIPIRRLTGRLSEALDRHAISSARRLPGGGTLMDGVLQDLRVSVRQLARRPAFTAVALLSLSVAIGANTLVYGMLDGFVFRPFTYPDPDRLVSIGVSFPRLSPETTYVEALSPAEYADITSSRSLSHVAAFDLGNRTVSARNVPERVFTALVLDDLFPVLGMSPLHGRGFTRGELAPGPPRVAILSHRLWQGRFGADPDLVGRSIRVSGEALTVVGIMPPGLLLLGTDLWTPWGGDPLAVPRNARQFTVLARLAPGSTREVANAELAAAAARIARAEAGTFAEYEGWRLTATPWAAALMQDLRPAAWLMLAAVALVLLIACANLTNLFLARTTTRHRDLAVRLALGASRVRIARHLLAESLVVASAGAAGGLAIAYVGLRGAGALIPGQFQMLGLEAGVNRQVLLVNIAVALASGLLVGLLPAWQATRTHPHGSMKADARSAGGRGGRLRQGLVVAEVALSVVLLLGAGLLIRSVHNIQRVDSGFESAGVVTMRLTLPPERYPGEAAGVFFDALIDRLSALPGVRVAAASSQFPPMGVFDTQFALEGAVEPSATLPSALITVASPGFFEALQVPIVVGRTFTAADRLSAPPVAIVNQAFGARYLPGSDPIGRRVFVGSPDREQRAATIVGVVQDYRNSGATQPTRPELYIPVRQQTVWNQLFVLVRSELDAASLLPLVRRTVTALDPDQPVYAIQTLEEAVALSSFQQRFSATLLAVFAMIALVLAAIGVYGVMSYTVSARTQEIGVRQAIGAGRGDVMWLVLRQVLVLSTVGLVIGVGVVIATGRAVERLLYLVHPSDPATIGGVALVLVLAAFGAGLAPALRASRVDPIEALRQE